MKLHRHPPERRLRGVTLAAAGCCCCCCCCLHSLSGLIGSAVACAKGPSTPEARRTVKLYWGLFLLSTAVGTGTMAMNMASNDILWAFILAAMGLPLAQLNASFLTLCASMFVALDLPTLGRITWKGFWWGLIGFLIMAVPTMLASYT